MNLQRTENCIALMRIIVDTDSSLMAGLYMRIFLSPRTLLESMNGEVRTAYYLDSAYHVYIRILVAYQNKKTKLLKQGQTDSAFILTDGERDQISYAELSIEEIKKPWLSSAIRRYAVFMKRTYPSRT